MKSMKVLIVAAGLGLGAIFGAQAAPSGVVAPGVSGGIELVSGGCGAGGHRDGYGHCRPNYRPEYRRCPPYTHPTPYGCRRNY